MHVIDYTAHTLRQFDSGTGPGNIGAEAGNDRQAAGSDEVGGLRDCGIRRCRLAANPSLSHARFLSSGVVGSVANLSFCPTYLSYLM
jgi:hypothetical protein